MLREAEVNVNSEGAARRGGEVPVVVQAVDGVVGEVQAVVRGPVVERAKFVEAWKKVVGGGVGLNEHVSSFMPIWFWRRDQTTDIFDDSPRRNS